MENGVQILNTEIVKDSQFESQIDIAKRYPRDLRRVIDNSIAIVTMDKETAETCNYSLPRAGKKLSGASVHLARIIVQQYGNLRVESRVTGNDLKQVHAEAVCFDLENNVAVKVTTSKSIAGNNGRFSEDMIVVTGKAAAAIAYRNAVFAVVPKSVVDKVYNAAMREITGDLSTEELIIKRRMLSLKKFKEEFGVEEKEILESLGLNTINQIKKDEIVNLIGMYNSLKEGEFSVDEMFNRKKKSEIVKVSAKEFNQIIADLKSYKTGLSLVQQKYKDSDLSEMQKSQIKEAGTITPERLDEIINLILNDASQDIKNFEHILTDEQLNEVQQAIIDNAQKEGN